jgi:fatty acid desaturase
MGVAAYQQAEPLRFFGKKYAHGIIEHLLISKETAVNEGKSRRGKWTPARVAQWWAAISASLAVLALRVFHYQWRPSDIMINVLVSLAMWYVVFLIIVFEESNYNERERTT